MKKLITLIALLPMLCFGQLKISQLTANPGIDGTEEVPTARSGSNFKNSYFDLKTWLDAFLIDPAITPISVDVATTTGTPSGTWTYNNGAAGVGATLTRTTNGALATTDGVASVAGNTYLLKNFTGANRKYNGPYTLTTVGTAGTATVFTRLGSGDESSELDGQVIIPSGGSTNARRIFSQTTPNPTVGTAAIIYALGASNGGDIYSDGRKDFTGTQSWDAGAGPFVSISPDLYTMTDGTVTIALDPQTALGAQVTAGALSSIMGPSSFSTTNTVSETVTIVSDPTAQIVVSGGGASDGVTITPTTVSATNGTQTTNYGQTGMTSDAGYRIQTTANDGNISIMPHGGGKINCSKDIAFQDKVIDTTAGDAATINSPAGRFRKDTTGATFSVTCSYSTLDSVILITLASDPGDPSAYNFYVTAADGSFDVTFEGAPVNNTDVNFTIFN